MPFKRTIESSIFKHVLGWPDSFWAIQDSVGYGCTNNHLDVRMVQYFLNKAAGKKILATDGSFGGKTWRAIKDFQERYRNVADGTVSAADGDKYYTPKQGKVYTIYELNIDFIIRYPMHYDDLRSDPDLPSQLRSHFSSSDEIFD